MEQRLSLVTLAVADVKRAIAFYAKLGWEAKHEMADIAFYQLNGLGFSLWERKAFAAETGLPVQSGGIALAHNLRSEKDVDALLAGAKTAGGNVVAATKREWGGYSGHFHDLDGHVWEVAFNPHWPLDAAGNLTVA